VPSTTSKGCLQGRCSPTPHHRCPFPAPKTVAPGDLSTSVLQNVDDDPQIRSGRVASKTHTDVVYSTPGSAALTLDLQLPATPGLKPLVIYVPGGGFMQADKGGGLGLRTYVAEAGYVVASMRYRTVADFFGNTYEAVVGVPQLIASADRQAGILATGSPVRYFAPIAPAAAGGTAMVLVESWRTAGDRRAVAAATVTLGATLVLSAYLIRSMNVPLLRGTVPEEAQPQLISRWHRGNAVRLGLLAATELLVRRVEASGSV
jgi:hypothetical protein